MNINDVPSPIDLRNAEDALEWANDANEKRPWRYDFFNYYIDLIQHKQNEKSNSETPLQVLEIGSGPGFLAKHLLSHLVDIQYTAADFSQAMHELSKSKLLTDELNRAKFILADFKTEQWRDELGRYDVVIIHQALHELRHKLHATNFHQQIQSLLKQDALYLVCDHIFAPDAMKNNELYMSKDEHFDSLKQAGFNSVELAKEMKGLCLFKCKL